jgi:hypothetical protein
MKVYHGTSDRMLSSILSRGLRPRGKTSDGNWKSYPSRNDMVYLSTAYAPYFAWSAVDIKKDEKALLVEVDLDLLKVEKLYPDEDFIAQALAKQKNVSIDAVHGKVRRTISGYRHHAHDSLHGLGNIAHRGIVPVSAITRCVTIDLNHQDSLAQVCMDVSVSVLNYQILGAKYRSVIEWIFGDREDFDVGAGVPNEAHFAMLERSGMAGYGERMREIWKNRVGIEVVLTSPATTRKMKSVRAHANN